MDPFETLGLPRRYDLDLASAERAHRELSRALHPDRYAQAGATERRDAMSRAIAVNEAWRLVRDPIARAEALFALLGVQVGEGREPKAEPEFLMEMLERREALSEAREAADRGAISALADAVRRDQAAALGALSAGFASGAAESVTGKLGELRFYRRFLDEVAAIEDDLAERDAQH
jgi:molecular chaperone HscB